jgi:hypothetical protein
VASVLDDFEVVRWHCHGKKAHRTKASRNKHKAHGCTPAKKHPRRGLAPAAPLTVKAGKR